MPETIGILLGKEGQGGLKAHMVRGTVGIFALKVGNIALAFGTRLLLARPLSRDPKTFGFADRGGLQCDRLRGEYGLRVGSAWWWGWLLI